MSQDPEKLFALRWDVDHRACITDGVPRIRELCREFGVRTSFFVNLGCSTNLFEWLRGRARSRDVYRSTDSINLIQKIGWPRFILETLLQRPVGLSCVPELERLMGDGHELALHGGMDHVVWSRRFGELPEEVLEADVALAQRHFTRYFGRPMGFASPGFQSDERVMAILDRLSYRYNGDAIGGAPRRATSRGARLGHWTIPVTLAGPRTIPFVEWYRARGVADSVLLSDFDTRLRESALVVLYAHPCYEGVHTDLLRSLFERVLAHGHRFVTHLELAQRFESESRAGCPSPRDE